MIDTSNSDVSTTMPLSVRVMANEDICTIQMEMQCNDKVSDVILELAEFTTENKYKLSLIKDGKPLKQTDSLAENHVTQLLCLKGNEAGPKTFMRFTQMDSPERQLSYIADEESLDAIQFIPQKDITFVGFSVYAVGSS